MTSISTAWRKYQRALNKYEKYKITKTKTKSLDNLKSGKKQCNGIVSTDKIKIYWIN